MQNTIRPQESVSLGLSSDAFVKCFAQYKSGLHMSFRPEKMSRGIFQNGDLPNEPKNV